MPTYIDHDNNDGFFSWTPSTSRSERLERAERLAQSIAEGSPLDPEVDSLLCNIATLNHERIAACHPVAL